MPLLSRQLFGLLREVGKIPLECGPAEQFAAAFQGLPELLLCLGQLLERVFGPLRVQLTQRLLQRGKFLPEFGGQGAFQLIAYLGQLALPG